MLFNIILGIYQFLVITPSGDTTPKNDVLDPTYKALDIILPVALGIVLLSGTLYAVAIGVQYSRAETSDDRQKAKKRLINAIIGFGLVLVLVSVLYAIRKPLGDFITSK